MKYSELVKVYEKLESTTKILEKTEILANFLRRVGLSDLDATILLLQGRVFPEWDQREIGLGARLAIKAIASASGTSPQKVEELWKKIGDLGQVAEKVLSKKTQTILFKQTLDINTVLQTLQKIAEAEGSGAIDRKINLLKKLLTNAEPSSAKYIIRTCLEELRVGAGEGVLRDAIVKAFNVDKKLVQYAYDLTANFGLVARIAKTEGNKGLSKVSVKPGIPIKVMLYQRVNDLKEAFETVGRPAAFEYKYDGFRLQIHRSGQKVWLYTRRLEDVTKQFPDVVEAVKKNIKSKEYIVDSEVIGYDKKTSKWLPFQNISQRIKRKYNIPEMVKKIPVIVNVFDIMYLNGKTMIKEPFIKRRKALEKIVKSVPNVIGLAKQLITDKEKEAQKFYEESLKKGNEGVMAKNLHAEYKPGSRVGYGVKIKPTMESLDLVIVGAEWGTGKRATWLSSFILACRDPETGEFLTIGKMGTGVKEKSTEGVSFKELTKMLKPLIYEEKGKEVKIKPKIVLEVAYEEIQRSPTYSSGFALRFPRLVRLRDDLLPEEADTIDRVKELFIKQRGRGKK